MKSKYAFMQPYKADKVRIGKVGDGAYILEKESINKIEVVLSYGCGWDTSFEESFSREKNIPIYIFDPTLIDKSMLGRYKDKFGKLKGAIRYYGKVVAFYAQLFNHKLNGRKIYFVNEGIAAENLSKYKTIGYHFQKYNLQGKKILLKIDVEGAEYAFWLTSEFKDLLNGVAQLTIEIHNLKSKFDKIKSFYTMMEECFLPIHIHGNNYAGTYPDDDLVIPNVIEVTWLNKELIKNKELDNGYFPDPKLDTPNNMKLKDIDLKHLWG